MRGKVAAQSAVERRKQYDLIAVHVFHYFLRNYIATDIFNMTCTVFHIYIYIYPPKKKLIITNLVSNTFILNLFSKRNHDPEKVLDLKV